MNNVVNIILAILPILIVSVFVVIFDKEREPFFAYVKCYFLGFFAICIVLFINSLLGIKLDLENKNLSYLFLYSFVFTALLEETCKLLCVLLSSKFDKNFNSYFDAIVYSVFIALGFSCFENIIFIVNDNFALNTIILRAVFSVPSHVAYGVFMGKYIELARVNPNRKVSNLLLAFFIPLFIHGLFDFLLLLIPQLVTSSAAYYAVIGSIEILLYIVTIREIVSSSKRSEERLPKRK